VSRYSCDLSVCLLTASFYPSAANFATRQAATAVVIPWVPKSFGNNKPVTHASASHPPRKIPRRKSACARTDLVEPPTAAFRGLPSHRTDNSFLRQFSLARSPMRSTCTSCLRQRTRWSSQLGATQDGAALLRGRKSFRWRQRLCSLHLSSQHRSESVQALLDQQPVASWDFCWLPTLMPPRFQENNQKHETNYYKNQLQHGVHRR